MARGRRGGGRGAEGEGREWRPCFVPAVAAANVAMFAVTMYVNDCPARRTPFGTCIGAGFLHHFSFQPLRQNPLFGPSASTLEKLGALEWIPIVRRHQEWRLFTCIWLHAGILHLLANMLSLLFIGVRLEQQFGFLRVGVIYLISGLGGSILSSLFIGSNISVGASGALLGVLGAMLSELITNWSIYANKAAALFSLAFIIAINLAIGLMPHVNNFSHIGGFLAGFLLGFVLLMRPQVGWMYRHNLPPANKAQSKYRTYQYVLLLIALILLLAGFMVGFVLLIRGERLNKHCQWCRYLDCIPTSRWRCID